MKTASNAATLIIMVLRVKVCSLPYFYLIDDTTSVWQAQMSVGLEQTLQHGLLLLPAISVHG